MKSIRKFLCLSMIFTLFNKINPLAMDFMAMDFRPESDYSGQLFQFIGNFFKNSSTKPISNSSRNVSHKKREALLSLFRTSPSLQKKEKASTYTQNDYLAVCKDIIDLLSNKTVLHAFLNIRKQTWGEISNFSIDPNVFGRLTIISENLNEYKDEDKYENIEKTNLDLDENTKLFFNSLTNIHLGMSTNYFKEKNEESNFDKLLKRMNWTKKIPNEEKLKVVLCKLLTPRACHKTLNQEGYNLLNWCNNKPSNATFTQAKQFLWDHLLKKFIAEVNLPSWSEVKYTVNPNNKYQNQ